MRSDDGAESPVTPQRDVTVRIPADLYERLLEQASASGVSLDEAASVALQRGLAGDESRATPSRLGTSRDILRPPDMDARAPSYAWTEDLVPSLPQRFRKYVAELLFDDERILMFLHRPAFDDGRHHALESTAHQRRSLAHHCPHGPDDSGCDPARSDVH